TTTLIIIRPNVRLSLTTDYFYVIIPVGLCTMLADAITTNKNKKWKGDPCRSQQEPRILIADLPIRIRCKSFHLNKISVSNRQKTANFLRSATYNLKPATYLSNPC